MAAVGINKAEGGHGPGILLFFLGMSLFTFNDALGKWLVAEYTVGQILLIRSIAALLLMSPWMVRGFRGLLSSDQPWLNLLRVVLMVAEVAAFYLAVRGLPLADVMTFYMAAPLMVTALSVPLLGEKVGPRRWAAVLIGFVGVLIVLRPTGAALSPSALIALGGATLFSLILIVTRRLRQTGGLGLITYQMLGTGLAGAATVPFAWVTPSGFDLVLLLGLGAVAMGAHLCLNRALSLAPAAVVAPYQYSTIVIAAALGWAIWGDVPTPQIIIGNLVIIASGLFVYYRERQIKGT
ncbi:MULTISPECIES: DMT family transporter [unclassified Inquilinus]|uniref:DMT family transporter n=1 Tax=unclassified Inquilinus TaxID=2645927 RepID=UPI003F8D96B1